MIHDISEILNYRHNPGFHSCVTTESESLTAWNYPDRSMNKLHLVTKPPPVFNKFKLWVNGHNDNEIRYNPDGCIPGVLINPDCISHEIFQKIQRFKFIHQLEFDYLVCAGRDRQLSSTLDVLEHYQHLFKYIFYEAKDTKCGWITTAPMGILSAYLLRCGGDGVLDVVNSSKHKTKLIGSSFYSRWTPELLGNLQERADLMNLMSSDDLIQNASSEPVDFYKTLSEFKFFASPIGCGLQTPKLFECILCETVPVVIEHYVHRELLEIYKFPMIIVNEWSDITQHLLEDWYEVHHNDIDWDEQKSKLLVENITKTLDMAIGFDITKIWNTRQGKQR
jgi:hypothetical protein